jgi:serine/threonine-protein kinase
VDTAEKKKIGKYEITGILGRGGMGVVYRAEDKRIGRLVAIKTLTEGFSGQPEMLERFYREAQAGILQHPNIVIVYDLGDEDGVPFIVMEYVSGEPLDKLIASGRQITLVEKLSIIEQVCSALGYAHHRGVIHRDIKPANVIVQPDGQAKIVDFGIARVQGSSSEGGLTRTGNVIGTIHYIAPERLRGRPFDGRSDIFAAGVMLYLMLTGELPFTGEDMTVLQKLVNEPHPPLKTYLANYPLALDAIVDRALAKDPEQRYATAEEFAADLHGLGEQLKKGQVAELFSDAERLASEQQFGRAREVLLQLVRIEPQHTGARQLYGVVQQNLARAQRAEQIRQLVAEAEEAAASSRFAEALGSLDNALQLDPDNNDLKTRIEDIRENKRRNEEIATLMSQAESARGRGDWTAALNAVQKALQLDQQDTRLRSAFIEFSRQAKLAAQQEQIREMLGKAKQEINSRRFTGAIEILREVGKMDPSLPEMESLLQTAVSGQELERRRKLIEQIEAEIEKCLGTENFDRATDLIERAVEQLPSEASLLQLKARVAIQARSWRVRHLIDTTAAKAQEIFQRAPGEALLIVQKALQELPGEERLLALEDSLRQRMRAAEKEEIRGRYLREAQGAIDRGEFDKAVEILESYQLEFSDAAGVGELLEFARRELDQQQRRARIASSVAQARELLEQEQLDRAMQLLEPAVQETADPTLNRLLEEARSLRERTLRKTEALLAQIAKFRERGQYDEAIHLLESTPASSVSGSPQNTLLGEIRAEKARRQAVETALSTANRANDLGAFQSAIETLQSVQRAYGESPDVARAISGVESRRAQRANETVAKSVESARAALLAGNPQGALDELRKSTEWFEFAVAAQQADWRRLNAEAAKPVARKVTASVPQVGVVSELEAPSSRSKFLIPIVVGALVVVAGGGAFWFHMQRGKTGSTQSAAQSVPAAAPAVPAAAPSGTLLIQGNTDNAEVFVNGVLKGFTLADGSLKLPLDPGSYSVKFVKPGYGDIPAVQVRIAANAQATMQFKLTLTASGAVAAPQVAFMSIQSTPGASVSIDNAPQGITDPRGNLIVQAKPGPHQLEIGLNGYQSYTQPLNLKAGEHTNMVAMLNAIPKAAAPVAAPALPPQALFSASSSTIQQGQSTTLSWQTANASDISIDNGIGAVGASGQKEVSPAGNTTYRLIAKGNGGTQQQTVSIVVEPKAAAVAPPSPLPVAVAPQPIDQSALLQAVINNFDAAFDAHDVARMGSIWTGMKPNQAKQFQDFFKGQPAAKVSDSCSPAALNLMGDTANWSCNETSTYNSGGKMQSHSVIIHFTFARKGGGWTILDRR